MIKNRFLPSITPSQNNNPTPESSDLLCETIEWSTNENISETNQKQSSTKHRLYGIGLMVLTSLFATFNASTAKYLHHLPTGELVVIVGLYSLCASCLVITMSGVSLFYFPNKKLVAARVLVGTASYVARVWSFQILPLGDASALVSTAPLFTGVIARIFIKETLSLVDILSMPVGLCGVVLISKPVFLFKTEEDHDHPPWYNSLVPVFSAVTLAMINVMQRKLGGSVDSVIISFYIIVAQLCVGTGYEAASSGTFFDQLPKCLAPRTLLVLSGVCQLAYFITANLTLKYEKATTSTLFRNVDTALAFFVQAIVFGVSVETLSVVGVLLIMLGTAGLTLAKMCDFTCGVEF